MYACVAVVRLSSCPSRAGCSRGGAKQDLIWGRTHGLDTGATDLLLPRPSPLVTLSPVGPVSSQSISMCVSISRGDTQLGFWIARLPSAGSCSCANCSLRQPICCISIRSCLRKRTPEGSAQLQPTMRSIQDVGLSNATSGW